MGGGGDGGGGGGEGGGGVGMGVGGVILYEKVGDTRREFLFCKGRKVIKKRQHAESESGAFVQVEPTPWNSSQVGGQKTPNLDQVENLAGGGISLGGIRMHFFCLWSSLTKDYVAWSKPEYSKSYGMHVSPTFSQSFSEVHLKTLIAHNKGGRSTPGLFKPIRSCQISFDCSMLLRACSST